MSDSTIQRSPHDKKNPYLMVARSLFQDHTVSLEARGLMGYLLTLPDDWKIFHKHLQVTLGISKEKLRKIMNELLEKGYASRTRERKGGRLQAYKYEICEFKKCSPERVYRAGGCAPTNKISKQIKKTTKEKVAKPLLSSFGSLEKLKLSKKVKSEISKRHKEQEVDIAVDKVLAQSNRRSDGACLRKALEMGEDWVAKPKDNLEENKAFLQKLRKFDSKDFSGDRIFIGEDYFELNNYQSLFHKFNISERDFIPKIVTLLAERDITLFSKEELLNELLSGDKNV